MPSKRQQTLATCACAIHRISPETTIATGPGTDYSFMDIFTDQVQTSGTSFSLYSPDLVLVWG